MLENPEYRAARQIDQCFPRFSSALEQMLKCIKLTKRTGKCTVVYERDFII